MMRCVLVVAMVGSLPLVAQTDRSIVDSIYRFNPQYPIDYWGDLPGGQIAGTLPSEFNCRICGQVGSRMCDRSDEVGGLFLCPHCAERYGPGIQKAVDDLVAQAKTQEADRIAERKARERQVKICEIEDRLRGIEAERTELAGKLSALRKE